MAGKLPIEQTSQLSQATRLRSAMGVGTPASAECQIKGARVAWQLVQAPLSGGARQTIICLHDLTSGSRQYRPLVTRIPDGAQLLLLDWPGHGRSGDLIANESVPDDRRSVEQYALRLHDILPQIRPDAALSDEPVILLASGFSGAVAIRYAAQHPETVKALVLCQPGGLVAEERNRRPKGSSSQCFGPPARHFPAWVQGLANTSTRWQAMRQQVIAATNPEFLEDAKDSLELSRPELLASVAELSCPILFTLSRADTRYPLESYLAVLEPLLESSPQHRFTVFAGGFHPLWDEPQRFAQALTGFVQAQLPVAEHQHAWLLTAIDWPARDLNLWKCVHPDCPAERILASGEDANALPISPAKD